jgi:hypothetical protein
MSHYGTADGMPQAPVISPARDAQGSLGRYGPGPVVELAAVMQMARRVVWRLPPAVRHGLPAAWAEAVGLRGWLTAGTAVAGLECAATIVGFMLPG